jgi:Fe-S-cluster-containing hydrogenase component 2
MLVIDINKCSGCRRCETHCSFFHSGKTGHMGARIKVEKIEDLGLDYPVVCHQCKEHYCTKCPQKAISITPRGSIEVSPTICDLCGGSPRCVEACEMGAITFDPEIKQSVSLEGFKKRTKKMSPPLKRYEYAKQGSVKLRENWFKDRSK